MIEVRHATIRDDAELAHIEAVTWATSISPAPERPPGTAFFEARRHPTDVLVGSAGDAVVGFAHIGQSIPVPSHGHVLELMGLSVRPAWHGRGVGLRLLQAAIEEASRRSARKVSLRVLATNETARRLYESNGFVVEGVLREEFLPDGPSELTSIHQRGQGRARRYRRQQWSASSPTAPPRSASSAPSWPNDTTSGPRDAATSGSHTHVIKQSVATRDGDGR